MERTDMKEKNVKGNNTVRIRCIEKSDPEYPQKMKQ